ncbi:hypothetical protein L915_11450 [Phytophthora nicotianae]|uniref:Uncharacterized protein n=1 Tax=Phytophthora nicotianae TaxID=4792 RepID=W2ITK7_PHYNI|nr:hypothetical protein L915_11450 [Phytophthora nicotianae]ETL36708.1 hypothetical protein L916_11360 [Phytophthora nicotianae]
MAHGNSRLLIVSLEVAGALRPLRAPLDSSNIFFRLSCLLLLSPKIAVCDGAYKIIVEMADGASFDRKCRVVRRLFTHLEGPERESLGGVRLPADPTRVVIVAISVGDAHPRDRRGDRSPSRRSSRSKNSHRSSRSGRASADSGMSEMAVSTHHQVQQLEATLGRLGEKISTRDSECGNPARGRRS